MIANKIRILGLGAGDLEQLPLGVYRELRNENEIVYARTLDHPVIAELQAEGVQFESFDTIYEETDDFENVYQKIVEELIYKSSKESVTYVVPGHPMLAEQTVHLLLEDPRVDVSLGGGQSYLDALFGALQIDPIDGFQFVDATQFDRSQLNYKNHLLFCQVYDVFTASEVKLTLLEDLPDDYPVYVVEAAGSRAEKIEKRLLRELDHTQEVNNLTTVYIPPVPSDALNHTFDRLREVVQTLRGPEGCPWDQEQTHESLRRYAIEEVYELVDAINKEDDVEMIEELGDVLLQIMLHSQIGEDDGYFSVDDVIKGVTEKMIGRHPHVFGDVDASSIEEVNANWEAIKKLEKSERTSILEGIPESLPALLRANKIQKKARGVGFQWDEVSGIWDKVHEELDEFRAAVEADAPVEMEKEFGDVLFTLVNIAIFYKLNPEFALTRTNEKFIQRFHHIETNLKQQSKLLEEATLEEMNVLWEAAKQKE